MSVWFDEAIFEKQWEKLQLPHLRNFLIKRENFNGKGTPFIKKIPSYMWFNQLAFIPPRDPVYRKQIARKIFGSTYLDWCSNEGFHSPYLPSSNDTNGYDLIHNRNKTWSDIASADIVGKEWVGYMKTSAKDISTISHLYLYMPSYLKQFSTTFSYHIVFPC